MKRQPHFQTMHKPISKSQPSATGPSFGAQDVLYVLFKHKWKIVFLSLLGFGAAAALYLNQQPIYKSESKLLIRYVISKGSVDPYEAMNSPSGGARGKGDAVIDTEIEILRSVDLALNVAESVGAERMVPDAAVTASLNDAAGLIRAGLEVKPGESSSVLYVNYSDKDPVRSKDVLVHLLERYFKRHLEIHRSALEFDLVAKQAEDAKARLLEKEIALDRLRKETGIMSLEHATVALSAQRSKTQEDLLSARAALAEKLASLNELEKDSNATERDATEDLANRATDSQQAPALAALPSATITEYRSIAELLGFLRKRDLELRVKFKPGNQLILLNQRQLEANDARRRELERQYPGLIDQTEVSATDSANPRAKWISEKAGLAAVQAKIDVLEAHLKEIGEQFGREYAVGAKIDELRRDRDMLDAEYRTLETKLKSARVETTLDPSRMPNITIVQHPTEPVKTFDGKMQKIILGIAGSGVGLGLGLAFLIELLFNRKIRKPIEIQTRLQLPLLLTIPYLRGKNQTRFLRFDSPAVLSIGDGNSELSQMPSEVSKPIAEKSGHFILPYAEAIRDRTIFNFEVNNVTHKPKLVAVTGLSERAGTSTIAAGVAKSFSEINGAKVLLVDLSSYRPEENPLFGELPRHSLNGALQLARNTQFRENPQNLYYASASARRDKGGLTTFSPMHLYELMPHLEASDYDYIIFDMPPVDQTSRTLTMAGMMDKVLLVLDAENTSRDALLWGYSELVKGKADVSCVFNKSRSPVPGWLIGEN
jgi:succinoglycan biosynthesis transport protein ExoP